VQWELFHVDIQMDGQADMMKLIVAFHNFANAPKKSWSVIASIVKRLQAGQRFDS
jgi:hypothetical protein